MSAMFDTASWGPGRFFRCAALRAAVRAPPSALILPALSDSAAAVNSIDFHRTEDLLVATCAPPQPPPVRPPPLTCRPPLAADDDSLRLYDVQGGALLKTLHAKTYGVSRVAFTHAPSCRLTASSWRRPGTEHLVCYHSLHDNAYLRFFQARRRSRARPGATAHPLRLPRLAPSRSLFSASLLSLTHSPHLPTPQGHTARILSLGMHPKSDAFLTAAADYSARMWDVRTNVCTGRVPVGASPCASWDHQGLIFAVVTADGVVKLFDSREYAAGPFDLIAFAAAQPGAPAPQATSISFSFDGKLLLVAAGGLLYVLDAYNGQRLHCFSPQQAVAAAAQAAAQAGQPPPPPMPQPVAAPEPSFSPDGKQVLCGCSDGVIRGWSTEGPAFNSVGGGASVAWHGHAGVPALLRFSPRRALAASGCTHGGLGLWVPIPPGA